MENSDRRWLKLYRYMIHRSQPPVPCMVCVKAAKAGESDLVYHCRDTGAECMAFKRFIEDMPPRLRDIGRFYGQEKSKLQFNLNHVLDFLKEG